MEQITSKHSRFTTGLRTRYLYACRSFGLNFVARLRVGLSHLRELKFRHNFRDSLNSTCDCCKDTETNKHFLLHFRNFTHERQSHLQNIKYIDSNLLSLDENFLTQTFLYGDKKFTEISNTRLLNPLSANPTKWSNKLNQFVGKLPTN